MTNASELLEGTTPGPWELRGPTLIYGNLQRDMNQTGDKVASMVSANDARLCVAAPDLARKVIQLEAQLAERDACIADMVLALKTVRAAKDYLLTKELFDEMIDAAERGLSHALLTKEPKS